ncbi:MAG: DUF2062 domain-containing protein [Deltaproteobacteria bacterium]|nr:DUF2062 domain-containing protein [Deltaproteobacteria bacterium]
MKFKPGRLIRYYYLRFIRLKGDPRAIARGAAVGTFFGATPTIPFHTVTLLIVTPLIRGNIVAAFLMSVVTCNPLTYLPQYYFAWFIGSKLTPYDLSWSHISAVTDVILSHPGFNQSLHAISSLGLDAVIVMLTGGVVIATPLAIIAYFATLRFFVTLQKKNAARHILN